MTTITHKDLRFNSKTVPMSCQNRANFQKEPHFLDFIPDFAYNDDKTAL